MSAAAKHTPEARKAANDDRGPLSDDQAYNLGQRYHLSSVGVRALAREVVEIGRNEWKEAVLDALAAWPGMDFPVGTPPREIIAAVLKIEREAALTLAPPPAGFPERIAKHLQIVAAGPYEDGQGESLTEDAAEALRWLAGREPSRPLLAGMQRTGSAVYALNARGVNRWIAWVQPGFDDDDRRISDAECIAIASALADPWKAADEPMTEPFMVTGTGERCAVPPAGWLCTRKPGHEGPCAAVPAGDSPPTTEEQCRQAVGALLRLQYCLSYNVSYCGEPPGDVKRAVAAWARRGAAAPAAPKPTFSDRALSRIRRAIKGARA